MAHVPVPTLSAPRVVALGAGRRLPGGDLSGVVCEPDARAPDGRHRQGRARVAVRGSGVADLRALSNGSWRNVTIGAGVAAVFLSAAYGATDEFHQRFVPGRTADLLDLAADMAGAAAAVAMVWLIARWRRRARRDARSSEFGLIESSVPDADHRRNPAGGGVPLCHRGRPLQRLRHRATGRRRRRCAEVGRRRARGRGRRCACPAASSFRSPRSARPRPDASRP